MAPVNTSKHNGPKPDEPRPSSSSADSVSSRAKSELEAIISGSTRKTKKERPQIPKWSSSSWRGKASAVAEIAHENASVGEESSKAKSESATLQLPQGLRRPLKSRPSYASLARVHISSDNNADSSLVEAGTVPDVSQNETIVDKGVEASEVATNIGIEDRPSPAPGWKGWWTRPKESGEDMEKPSDSAATKPDMNEITDLNTTENDQIPTHTVAAWNKDITEISPSVIALDGQVESTLSQNTVDTAAVATADGHPAKSWFGMWNNGQTAVSESQSTNSDASPLLTVPTPDEEPPTSVKEGINMPVPDKTADDNELSTSENSGAWAFWSREKRKTSIPFFDSNPVTTTAGELAVEGSASQSNPESVQLKEEFEKPASNIAKPRQKSRPVSLGNAAASLFKGKQVEEPLPSDDPTIPSPVPLPEPVTQPEEAQTSPVKNQSKQTSVENLLLPAFRKTYREEERPSYYEQLLRMIGQSEAPKPRHLFLAPVPLRIQNALAIGVHGYFPGPLIQRVLGQPTGTSVRFANGAAAAIHEYTAQRGYSCDIEKIALEGEGTIADRVDALWKLLLNWLDQIRKADLILVACHSQGVPVAIMLVARLVELKCLSKSVRIGVCAMAGVNLGPFSSFQSRYLSGSAAELFDFALMGSAVSKLYQSALEVALKHHVRISYVGSIDDQLVSLESSTFASITHPYVYRAVFVDGRLHAPDFITHLVGFALKLRNMGVPDHGLIRELSTPLAGSLYGGEGHSRIYEDQAVYTLAVEHALDTANIEIDVPLEVARYEVSTSANTNPYFLPWAMRGVLEEKYVKKELQEETQQLLDQFDGWNPSSKVLKDVKFRLEAVKSKLGGGA